MIARYSATSSILAPKYHSLIGPGGAYFGGGTRLASDEAVQHWHPIFRTRTTAASFGSYEPMSQRISNIGPVRALVQREGDKRDGIEHMNLKPFVMNEELGLGRARDPSFSPLLNVHYHCQPCA